VETKLVSDEATVNCSLSFSRLLKWLRQAVLNGQAVAVGAAAVVVVEAGGLSSRPQLQLRVRFLVPSVLQEALHRPRSSSRVAGVPVVAAQRGRGRPWLRPLQRPRRRPWRRWIMPLQLPRLATWTPRS
jgi:hypothetical protein